MVSVPWLPLMSLLHLSPDPHQTRIYNLKQPPHTVTVGAEPDRGPPSASAAGRLQDHACVVHQGEEDEGHLPHAQSVQHRRHPEMSDR